MNASNTNRHLHLYWFSGSGNTHQAAVAFARRLAELDWTVELRALERSASTMIDPKAVLGLAFPTHSFSIPEIVLTFVRSLPHCEGTMAMMLGTHGAFSGGVMGPMKRELTVKGFQCSAARILAMPDNFFPFTSDVTNQKRLKRGLDQAVRYAEYFAAGTTSWARWAILSDIFGACCYRFFASRKLFRRYFSTVHVQRDRCCRCGTCVRFCPTGALEMKESFYPSVNKKCANCLRCVALCPKGAMRHMIGFYPYRSEEAALLQNRFGK